MSCVTWILIRFFTDLRQPYESYKKNLLAAEKFSDGTLGLVKPEFDCTRDLWLTAKCYLVQSQNKMAKNLHFEHHRDMVSAFQRTAIASKLEGKDIDKAKNVGFRVYDQDIVTFEQNKLGLSAHYNKHCVD